MIDSGFGGVGIVLLGGLLLLASTEARAAWPVSGAKAELLQMAQTGTSGAGASATPGTSSPSGATATASATASSAGSATGAGGCSAESSSEAVAIVNGKVVRKSAHKRAEGPGCSASAQSSAEANAHPGATAPGSTPRQ
ncbi:MAG: hypothetical protein ACREFJ_14795 [Acetobacteraceae bacterium]